MDCSRFKGLVHFTKRAWAGLTEKPKWPFHTKESHRGNDGMPLLLQKKLMKVE